MQLFDTDFCLSERESPVHIHFFFKQAKRQQRAFYPEKQKKPLGWHESPFPTLKLCIFPLDASKRQRYRFYSVYQSGEVAQLGEHRIRIAGVGSSNLLFSTKEINGLRYCRNPFFCSGNFWVTVAYPLCGCPAFAPPQFRPVISDIWYPCWYPSRRAFTMKALTVLEGKKNSWALSPPAKMPASLNGLGEKNSVFRAYFAGLGAGMGGSGGLGPFLAGIISYL